jgi:glycine C-acetyltransferase/8-amino-7-oxononanoate synthase
MIEIEARLHELRALGLHRRTRLVSGPQGPRVVLDGKPVLLLCSNNYLGLADHPSVRRTAADAATRWGVGAGASRLTSGTMTIHRRLEERLAVFCGRESALLFSSDLHAAAGVIPALARPGDVVFSDELAPAAIIDGCRLSRAEVFVYDHGDVEHLAWGIGQAEGRGTLIVTASVFAADGAVAPLEELVELAHRREIRLLVDEAHGIGTLGPGGRGVLAQAGLEDHVDVIVGALDTALGSSGAFVACDELMARYLARTARTFAFASAPPPPAAAGALAALELLESRPGLVERLRENAWVLRQQLAAEGFDLAPAPGPIVSLRLAEPALAVRTAEAALARGVFAQAMVPPAVAPIDSGMRLTVMASHRAGELRAAARVLAAAARDVGLEPARTAAVDPAPPVRVFDFQARAA